MLEQSARVVRSSEQGVWVEAAEPEACGVCVGQGCASRRIAELFQRAPRQYRVESRLPVSPGDSVIIGVPEGSVLRSAIYLYGTPLILMLGGALLVQFWFPGDAGAAGGAMAGILAAGILIASTSPTRRAGARPVVIRRGQLSESIIEEESIEEEK